MDRNWGTSEPIEDAISDNVVPCPKCDTTFLEVGSMKRHFAKVHDEKYGEWKENLP